MFGPVPERAAAVQHNSAHADAHAKRNGRAADYLFRGSLVVIIWVGVGRITDFVPFIRGMPLGKVAMAVAFFTYWIGRARSASTAVSASRIGRTAIMLAVLAVLSLGFSVWQSQTLHVLVDCSAVAAEFWLIFKASTQWRTIKWILRSVTMAAATLAFTAVVTYSGGRAEVHSSYDTNDLAYVLVTVLPLGYAFAVTARGKLRLAWYALCALLTVVVILTSSRGGAIGLMVVLFALALAAAARARGRDGSPAVRRVLSSLLGLMLAGALTWPLLPSDTRERLTTLTHLTADYNMQNGHDARTDIWKRGLLRLVQRPIGYGMGAFSAVDGMSGGQYRAAHNSEVQVAVELGFIGLFLLLRIYVLCWNALGRIIAWRPSGDAPQPGGLADWYERNLFAIHLRISLIGCIVAGSFLSQAYSNLMWVLIAVIAGMSAGYVPAPQLARKIP